MREIELSQGKVALVDDDDYDWLSQWKWSAAKRGRLREVWYAVRVVQKNHKKTSILMHRLIAATMGLPRADHRDHDGLNNQRDNLRDATQAQNTLNTRPHADKKGSRFKGVWFQKQNRNYVAEFRGRHLGCFADEVEAARAYDAAALAFSPEFARVNFPQGGESCRV